MLILLLHYAVMIPHEAIKLYTVSVRVGPWLVETLYTTDTTEHVLRAMCVERVGCQIIITLQYANNDDNDDGDEENDDDDDVVDDDDDDDDDYDDDDAADDDDDDDDDDEFNIVCLN